MPLGLHLLQFRFTCRHCQWHTLAIQRSCKSEGMCNEAVLTSTEDHSVLLARLNPCRRSNAAPKWPHRISTPSTIFVFPLRHQNNAHQSGHRCVRHSVTTQGNEPGRPAHRHQLTTQIHCDILTLLMDRPQDSPNKECPGHIGTSV
jgi:hypothetical protein